MVGFNASRFVLATGAGIAPPDERQPVNVNVGVSVGYVVNLARPNRDAQGNPLVGPSDRP